MPGLNRRGKTENSRRHAERRGLSPQGQRPGRPARRRQRRSVLSRPRAHADEADARAAQADRGAWRFAKSGQQAGRAQFFDLRQGERHFRLVDSGGRVTCSSIKPGSRADAAESQHSVSSVVRRSACAGDSSSNNLAADTRSHGGRRGASPRPRAARPAGPALRIERRRSRSAWPHRKRHARSQSSSRSWKKFLRISLRSTSLCCSPL